MSGCLDSFDKFASTIGNRDKIMAIAQFLPLMLYGPAKDAGCANLSKSLQNLSNMADSYRAITRLALLASALSKPTLKQLAAPKGDLFLERTQQVSHAFHVLYCIFENSAVYAGHGVYPSRYARLGGCAVVCWFYVLVLGVSQCIYKLTQKPLSEEEKKQTQLTLLKLSCFLVFSLSCQAADGPQLLESVSGPLAPLHKLLRVIAPAKVAMPDTIRGALGLTASVCDFY